MSNYIYVPTNVNSEVHVHNAAATPAANYFRCCKTILKINNKWCYAKNCDITKYTTANCFSYWIHSRHSTLHTEHSTYTLAKTNNPFGNLNSGRRPWAKLIRSASLQCIFDAAIAKLLWRLVSRCFHMSICVFFYDNVELRWMGPNVYWQSPGGDTERFLTVMHAVCRLLDKLHIFSKILCTCSIFIKMWAQI